MDKQEFTRESISANLGTQLMLSTLTIGRAHDESLTKSNRAHEVWENKRQHLDEKKLTTKCPAWLEYNKDTKQFDPIPDRVAIIRRIFKMSLDGMGAALIVKTLNSDPDIAWKPEKRKRNHCGRDGWWKSTVTRLLKNRALLGEYQPYVFTKDSEGKTRRTPYGEPIPNYFPAVVDESTFYQVQQKRRGNAQLGGRPGKTVRSIFGTIARCGVCGGPMRPTPRGSGGYFQCDAATRGLGCIAEGWRCEEAEDLVLNYIDGLDYKDLLGMDKAEKSRLATLRSTKEAAEGKLKDIGKRQNNIEKGMEEAPDKATRDTWNARMAALLKDKAEQQAIKKQAEGEIAGILSKTESIQERLENTKELIAHKQKAKGDKLMELRKRLRRQLRDLVERVDLFPIGNDTVAPWMRKLSTDERRKYRELAIHMKSGNYKVIAPEHVPPLKEVYLSQKGVTFSLGPGGNVDVIRDEELEEARINFEIANEMMAQRQRIRGRARSEKTVNLKVGKGEK